MSNRRTPLHPIHESLGARIIDFGGWDMPVQYEGIVAESKATRTQVGLFDIGHMNRIEFLGPDRVAAVDWCMSCNVANLTEGRVKYGLLLTERGTALDDILIYFDSDRIHAVVNAGNRDQDVALFRERIAAKDFDCTVIDAGDGNDPNIGQSLLGVEQTIIALQGPSSEALLQRVVNTETDLSELGYYRNRRSTVIGLPCLLSRTGYTGEDGFEIFFDAREAERVWNLLMSQGEDLGATPVGLGARDALRTEAGMPLYGHELDQDTTPLEAGLKFGVQLKAGDFFGKAPLVEQHEQGVKKTLVGLEVDTKRVPRPHCLLMNGDEQIGVVTSGTFSPTLQKNIAMGFVPPAFSELGTTFEMDIRGKRHGCKVVPMPFYKREKK